MSGAILSYCLVYHGVLFISVYSIFLRNYFRMRISHGALSFSVVISPLTVFCLEGGKSPSVYRFFFKFCQISTVLLHLNLWIF